MLLGADVTSATGDGVKKDAMKTAGFCVLSVLLWMAAAHGGIPDALGASGPPLPPSSAASPPALDIPAGGAVRDAPAGAPRNPSLTPMPAPARTNHYARPAENPPGQAVLPRQPGIDSGSRRSYSLLTTA
jgi:hypothetical protein